jgi:PKD repeat protein
MKTKTMRTALALIVLATLSSQLPAFAAQPPACTIKPSPITGTVGQPVAFKGQVSDPGGTISAYAWYIYGQQVATTQNMTNTFDAGGTYEVAFTATDRASGAVGSTTTQYQVTDPAGPQPITLALTPPDTNGDMGFSWNTIAGKHYRVDYKDTLRQTSWDVLADNMLATSGRLSLTISTHDSPARFYRVAQLD